MDGYDIVVTEDGDLRFVYADELAEVFAGDPQRTRRVSNVEPAANYEPLREAGVTDGWVADMSPVGGPILLANGRVEIYRRSYSDADKYRATIGQLRAFPTRAEALQAEREWLRKERGL